MPVLVGLHRVSAARPVWTITVGSLLLAALSLIGPAVPTYDPFSWIIWGREIAHGTLDTTIGPSWKPLPVILTTVFSLLGDTAAPTLWLVVARAGAIAAVVVCALLVRRLGGGTLAVFFSVLALTLAPWWLRNAALGNSEGITVLVVLVALDRILVGDHRWAFFAGLLAGLLRPECWPFLALYGLWLLWRRRLPVPIVIGSGIAVLSAWLIPEYLGSGDLFRAANRARRDISPSAPTFADNPVLAILRNTFQTLPIGVTIVLALAAIGLLVTWSKRSSLTVPMANGQEAVKRRAVGGILMLALLWIGVVMLMTNDGFSGNQRYLIIPVSLLIVLYGIALEYVMRFGAAITGGWLYGGNSLLIVALLALIVGQATAKLKPTFRQVVYDDRLTTSIKRLLAETGGGQAVDSCGPLAVGRFYVPQVTWFLNRPMSEMTIDTPSHGTVVRVRAGARGNRWEPTVDSSYGAPIAQATGVEIYRKC